MFSYSFPDAADYAVLRELLTDAAYTTERICERMELPTVYNFQAICDGRTSRIEIESKLDLLIRLFMDAEPVAWSTVRSHLGDREVTTFERLGLVTDYDGDRARATLLLYPTESLYIASDLNRQLVGDDPTELADDVVYPAITKNTQHFLSSLPATPCERLLELCSGTGIAALMGASRAGHAWAIDVTTRSTTCARFNAALNGIENVTALEGDLYEPVRGETFDRIVAHPPYIASDVVKLIFRDGGVDGEQLTRRIIGGLPQYLAPGGRLHCTCTVTDREEGPFEERVRSMLGEQQENFDVAVVEMGLAHPSDHYCKQAIVGRIGFEEAARRHEAFRELGVTRLVYCSFVVQRAAERRSVFTIRTQRGPRTTGKEFDWLMTWGLATTDHPDYVSLSLMDARPRASSRARLMVVHDMKDLTWTPAEFTLGAESPFVSKADCPEWGAALLARCDGEHTFRDHFKSLVEAGALPDTTPEEEFLDLARALVGAGFVEVEEFPFPRSHAEKGGWLTASELFSDGDYGEVS